MGASGVICAGQDSDVQGLCSHLHLLGPNVQAPSKKPRDVDPKRWLVQ